jgi:hypothetical protein
MARETWTGVGVKPTVLRAEALSETLVRVTFSEAMTNNAALTTPGNYVFTPAGDSAAVSATVVTPESGPGPSYVDVTLNTGMSVGQDNYNVAVDNSVKDLAGNTLDPAADDVDFDGYGVRPEVRRVVSTEADLATVRVVYTKAVKQVSASNPDDALNPDNYSIAGASSVVVSSVATVSPNIVDLTVGGQVAGGEYTLTVENVEDLANNPIA